MTTPNTAAATARAELDAALRSLRLTVPEGIAADVERKANAAIEAAAAAPPIAPPPADSARPAPPQAVIQLAEALYEARNTLSLALSAWGMLPDDPEAVAGLLARKGISPTALAEVVEAANASLRQIVELES